MNVEMCVSLISTKVLTILIYVEEVERKVQGFAEIMFVLNVVK
jgi:hypothetical protein